jgi:hypothetical protein
LPPMAQLRHAPAGLTHCCWASAWPSRSTLFRCSAIGPRSHCNRH